MNLINPEPMLSVRVVAEIRTAILNGSLSPGSRIRQEEIAARLGVSRAPVRQALLVLEREGLVHLAANHGAIVAPVDPLLVSEIYEFREAVEGYVAAKVAAQSDFDATTLRKVIAQGRSAVHKGGLEQLIDLDLSFHSELYRASGNRVLMNVMQTQWDHIRRVMMMTLKTRTYRTHVWDEHAAILDAIARRQVSRARAIAAAHTRGARRHLTASLRKHGGKQQEK